MSANGSFFLWFYFGLGGIGGWLIFLLLALAAVIWVLYDSASRRIPAPGWKLGIIVAALLLLPAALFKLGAVPGLSFYSVPNVYLGVLGGIVPLVLAVGYFAAYQGMVGCPYGHVYESVLGACPYDPVPETGGGYVAGGYAGSAGTEYGVESQQSVGVPATGISGAEMEPAKPKAPAWLVTADGREHQLNQGVTVIGRAARSDVVLDDPGMGREHAKIIEDNGVFRLHDLGSANHTYVNDERVGKPVILEADDRISFGRKTVVKFVYTRR